MRVIFIVQHPIEGPTSRYRVYQFLPYLRQNGVEATVLPFMTSKQLSIIYGQGQWIQKFAITIGGFIKRFSHVLCSRRYDIVYIEREAFPFGPPFFEHLLKHFGKRMIYDFDDAIYTRSVAYNNPLDRLRDWQKPGKIIRAANHVIVGSDYLSRYAMSQCNDPAKVKVIPTVVDSEQYIPRYQTKNNGSVVIGWIGTPRGTSYLIKLLPMMRDLAGQHSKLKFLFIGAEPFDSGDLPIEFKTWRLEDEIADVQSFDIGIMPLVDDEESRGKCGFKLIQYMSVGIPSVCSPIGANIDIIEDGRSGFFATTLEDWRDKLNLLIDNPELRHNFGVYGRAVVEQSFSLKSAAPRLYNIFTTVMGDSRKGTENP
jgi:glycosyltransferase involved in cell wall biosynthesis